VSYEQSSLGKVALCAAGHTGYSEPRPMQNP
jgi:hypothetical protein